MCAPQLTVVANYSWLDLILQQNAEAFLSEMAVARQYVSQTFRSHELH